MNPHSRQLFPHNKQLNLVLTVVRTSVVEDTIVECSLVANMRDPLPPKALSMWALCQYYL